jgi:hypothetical protein
MEQDTQSCGKTDWNHPSLLEPLSFALLAATHDIKVKEGIELLAREYGKLGEPWQFVSKVRAEGPPATGLLPRWAAELPKKAMNALALWGDRAVLIGFFCSISSRGHVGGSGFDRGSSRK